MKFGKAPGWLKELFVALQPEAGGEPRQMFGYPCAFENDQLFMGLFGDGLFVRLAQPDREALLAREGAKPFDPTKGRPMRAYVVVPPGMLEDEEELLRWMRKAREFAAGLPLCVAPAGGPCSRDDSHRPPAPRFLAPGPFPGA